MEFLAQLLVLFTCLFIGSRLSGIGLGLMGMVGLLVFLFVFGMRPADPPLEVMLIILSVVTAAAALQAAGGMDLLVGVAEKVLRKNPQHITILGPLITYLFTLFAGTAHISYSLMPIIAEVATRKRIRPERALSMSVTAAHMGITASPVSAACAALLTVLAPQGISLLQILGVCIPATLFGVCVGIASVWRKGADLDSDPEFLQKLKDPAFAASLESVAEKASSNGKEKYAARSVWLFAAGVFFVVLLGSIPSLIPSYPVSSNFSGTFTLAPSGRIQIAALIMMVMLAVTGLIVLTTGTSTAAVAKSSLFGSAGQAAIAVFGVVWMSGTFMGHNHDLIQGALKNIVTAAPWLFAVALFALSTLLFSQAATAKALMPLGLTLGLAPSYLIGIFPAVNGHFFIPGYPTLLTAIQFDRTGTTRIGKYVVNHSFMLPGLITTGASVVIGIVLNKIFL